MPSSWFATSESRISYLRVARTDARQRKVARIKLMYSRDSDASNTSPANRAASWLHKGKLTAALDRWSKNILKMVDVTLIDVKRREGLPSVWHERAKLGCPIQLSRCPPKVVQAFHALPNSPSSKAALSLLDCSVQKLWSGREKQRLSPSRKPEGLHLGSIPSQEPHPKCSKFRSFFWSKESAIG